jgi:hypothetical protein
MKKVKRVIGGLLTIFGAVRGTVDLLESIKATREYAQLIYSHRYLAFGLSGPAYLTVAVLVIGIGLIFAEKIQEKVVSIRETFKSPTDSLIGTKRPQLRPGESVAASTVDISTDTKTAPVDVELTPSEGQSDKLFLAVKNKGAQQGFTAQGKILNRRHDPNLTQRITYDLQWQSGGTLKVLSTGQVGNLLIATAGEDRKSGMEWMQLRAFDSHMQPNSSNWNVGDKTPEYDIEVTILGAESNKAENFTIRAGRNSALQMVKLSDVPAERVTDRLLTKVHQEPNIQQPDVALKWEFPKDVRKINNLMGRTEKDIIIHNRSNEYVYNVRISTIELGAHMVFDLITELAPDKEHVAVARWDGKSTQQTQYIYFFSHVEEEARQKGLLQNKPDNTGLRSEWYKIPVAVHYEARNVKWEVQLEFTYDPTQESFFTRIRGKRV